MASSPEDDEQYALRLASQFEEEKKKRQEKEEKASIGYLQKLQEAEGMKKRQLTSQVTGSADEKYVDEWKCARCTLVNSNDSSRCEACGSASGIQSTKRQRSSSNSSGIWNHKKSSTNSRNGKSHKSSRPLTYGHRNNSAKEEEDSVAHARLLAEEEAQRKYDRRKRMSKIESAMKSSGVSIERLQTLKSELVSQQATENKGLCVDGVMQLIARQYRSLPAKKASETRVRLASLEGINFYFSNPGQNDAGAGWACGWRNLQMLCNAVIHRATLSETTSTGSSSSSTSSQPSPNRQLFGGSKGVPKIEYLQRWLEIAWEEGFDPVGRAQLSPIYGTRKWIGSTEAATLLRSFGVRANIVEFIDKDAQAKERAWRAEKARRGGRGRGRGRGSRGGRQLASASHTQLLEWVWNYFCPEKELSPWTAAKKNSEFENNGALQVSNKLPLYFQHQGHSRTIVGIERKFPAHGPAKASLIVLDPAHDGWLVKQALETGGRWQSKIKRGLHTLRRAEYQIVYVHEENSSIFMTSQEREKSKKITASPITTSS